MLWDRSSQPYQSAPSNKMSCTYKLLVNILDHITVFAKKQMQLFLNITQFPKRPTCCERRVKQPPVTAFSVNTMNPLNPKSFAQSTNMPSHFPNNNHILSFDIPNTQASLLFKSTNVLPINQPRLSIIIISIPQVSSTNNINLLNHNLR